MAVAKIAYSQQFVGLTSDSKPTDGIPAGSIFWAYDSGTGGAAKYIYTGAAWALDVSGSGGTASGAVSLAATLGHGTAAAAIRVELPTDGTGQVAISQTTPGTTNLVAVASSAYSASVSFTRTADTNAYTAGDVIGINAAGSPGSAIHTFASIGPTAGHVMITDASLEIDATSVPSGMTSFRLYLYDASPDAIVDNAAWDLSSSGDRGKYLGYVDLGVIADLGSTLYVEVTQVNKRVKLASASTSLYAQLVTNGAWTPASGTTLVLKLGAIAV